MATIFYGVAGEGRGHAARALALTEALRTRHRVVLYASGQAYDMLAPFYASSEIRVHQLPLLGFRYGPGRRLSYIATGLANMPYLQAMPANIEHLRRQLDAERPDLVLTDFEPLLARAADRAGVPLACLLTCAAMRRSWRPSFTCSVSGRRA